MKRIEDELNKIKELAFSIASMIQDAIDDISAYEELESLLWDITSDKESIETHLENIYYIFDEDVEESYEKNKRLLGS